MSEEKKKTYEPFDSGGPIPPHLQRRFARDLAELQANAETVRGAMALQGIHVEVIYDKHGTALGFTPPGLHASAVEIEYDAEDQPVGWRIRPAG